MANAPKSIRVVENTTVAGTRHVPAMAAIAEGYGKGDRLSLVRDAANPHALGRGGGATRRPANRVRLLRVQRVRRPAHRRRQVVEGRLTDKEQIGSWTRLVMEVVLND